MRRIFTLSFAFVCLTVISSKSFSQTIGTYTTTQCNNAPWSETQNFTSPTNAGGFFGGTNSTWSIDQATSSDYRLLLNAVKGNTYTLITPTYFLSSPTLSMSYSIAGNAALSSINLYIQTSSGTTLLGAISGGNQCFPITGLDAYMGQRVRFVFEFTTSTQNSGTGTITFDNWKIGPVQAAIALPVHFSNVAVSKAAEGALVTWNVGTEQNVSGYDVEKSVDGRSFAKIGFVSATGQSSYSFADAKAGVVNFYRIKSVDLDGKYSFSTVVALNNGAASVVVKAFMSDKNTLTVQHDAAQAGSRISVVSMDGRVVKMQLPTAGAQQTTVDLSAAQTGLYIIRYDNGQGGSQSIKVAK